MQTSELKQGETLRGALDFRERVMAAATYLIVVIDSEGKIVLANRAAAEVCVGEVEEVIGRSIYNCISPNDVVRVTEIIQITLAHGLSVSNAECEALRRDGMPRTLRFSLQPLTLESGERGLVGAAEDVTERKKSEAKLCRSLAEAEPNGAGAGRVEDSGGSREVSHHACARRFQLADRGDAGGGQTPRPPSEHPAVTHAQVEHQQAVVFRRRPKR